MLHVAVRIFSLSSSLTLITTKVRLPLLFHSPSIVPLG